MDMLTQGEITAERKEWVETLGGNSEAFQRSLAELGIDADLIESDIAKFRRAKEVLAVPLGPKGPDAHTDESNRRDAIKIAASRKSFFNQIRDLLAGREYVVEDSVVREMKIRLFWLNCPDTEGSRVIYKDEFSREVKGGFVIKVFGTGMGANQSVKISYESEFEAAKGASKAIFVHYPLSISLVKVFQNGRLVGKGLRSEVPEDSHREFRLGIGSETKEDSEIALLQASVREEIIPLADDKTDSVQTYSKTEEYMSGLETMAGLKAFDMETTSTVEFKRSSKVTLTFKLPVRRDYVLRRDKYGRGIWWA